MSTERDAGLQALQQGNPAAAAPLLETACQQDPADFDALLFLGAAYGQLGRQMDAITTITRAVQLQPANAQARYNLAVAMEQGGYRDQAVQALGQALTLQPDYPKAQEALRRLQGGSPASGPGSVAEPAPPAAAQSGTPAHEAPTTVPSNHGFGAPLSNEQPAPSASPYGAAASQPPANESGLPQFGFGQVGGGSGTVQLGAMPPAGEQPAPAQPQWGAPAGPAGNPQPSAQPLFGAPPPASGSYGQQGASTGGSSVHRSGLAGNVETPAYGAPQSSSYGAPTQHPSGGPAGNPYGAPVNQGLYSQSASTGGAMRNTSYQDSFDLAQAFKDWIRIITQPAAYFQEITGTTGYNAAFAMLVLYLVPGVVWVGLSLLKTTFTVGIGTAIAGAIGLVIMAIFAIPIFFVGELFVAWLLHLFGLIFGNKSEYSASFRALVFGSAPGPIFLLVSSLLSLVSLQGGLIGFLLLIAAFVWVSVLLVMAVASEQEIATGPAVGVVVLTDVVLLAIGGIISFILFVVIGNAIRGMLPH